MTAVEFIAMVARLEKDSEFFDRTGDNLSGDDCVDTLAGLIEIARSIQE